MVYVLVRWLRNSDDNNKTTNEANSGAGVPNKINLEYDKNTKEFVVSFNGYEVKRFTVQEEVNFKNSKRGYVVVISPNENFPASSVKVTFEEE